MSRGEKIPLILFGTSATDYQLCIRSVCHHETFSEGVHNIYFHVENLKCTFKKNIILGYNQLTYRSQTIFCYIVLFQQALTLFKPIEFSIIVNTVDLISDDPLYIEELQLIVFPKILYFSL